MHSHHHPHDHDDHAHHAHAPDSASSNGRRERRLLIAFALTTITLVVEAIGGWVSGSLALLADAGHMLHHDQPEALARLVREFIDAD